MLWLLLGVLRLTTSFGGCDKPWVGEMSVSFVFKTMETPYLNSLGRKASHQSSPSLVDEANINA